jgi:hypothetical protein
MELSAVYRLSAVAGKRRSGLERSFSCRQIRLLVVLGAVLAGSSNGVLAEGNGPFRVHVVIGCDCSPDAWPGSMNREDDKSFARRSMLINVGRMLGLLADNIPAKQLDVMIVEPPSLSADAKLDAFLSASLPFPVTRRRTLSTDGLLEAIRSLSVNDDDVIWFYYTGHGGFIRDREKHALLIAKPGHKVDVLYRSTIRDALNEKHPKLAVLLTDCCQNVLSINDIDVDREKPAIRQPTKVSRLFGLLLSYNGVVDVTSSAKGQFSWTWGTDGSLFTHCFVSYLTELSKKKERVAWQGVQSDVAAKVDQTYRAKKAVNPNLRAQETQLPMSFSVLTGGVRLGIRAKTTAANDGVEIKEVIHGTPADKAQFKVGDVIYSINGQSIHNEQDYDHAVDASSPEMTLGVRRGSGNLTLQAKISGE